MIAITDVASLNIPRVWIAQRRIHEGDFGSPHLVLDHRIPRLNDHFSRRCALPREIPPCPRDRWRPGKCHLDLSRYILRTRCLLRKGRHSIRRDTDWYLSIFSSKLRTVVTGWRNIEDVINVIVSAIIFRLWKNPTFNEVSLRFNK